MSIAQKLIILLFSSTKVKTKLQTIANFGNWYKSDFEFGGFFKVENLFAKEKEN